MREQTSSVRETETRQNIAHDLAWARTSDLPDSRRHVWGRRHRCGTSFSEIHDEACQVVLRRWRGQLQSQTTEGRVAAGWRAWDTSVVQPVFIRQPLVMCTLNRVFFFHDVLHELFFGIMS